MKAPEQTEIAMFSRPPTTREQHALAKAKWEAEVLPVVRAAIERLTEKECAVLFDSSPSGISDALAHRDRKRPAMAWLVALLVGAPEAIKLELLTALCGVAGYRVPERARQLTEAERLRIYEEETARLAPGIVAQIQRRIEEG